MVAKKKQKTKKVTKTKSKKKASTKKVEVTVNVTVVPQKKPVRKNYVMMVLDESSSMGSIRDQAISAFNEQVKTIREAKGNMEVSVNLVKFASEVTTVFADRNADTVENLNTLTYVPNGMTAMYDGVGTALDLLKSKPDINNEDVTVLVLIISDGEENSSRRWSASRVAEQIKTLQGTGRWTFTYAGANQDLSKISQTLNIPLGNTVMFAATAAGMTANNMLRSNSTKALYSSYNSGDTLSVQSFYDPNTVKTDDTTTKQ